MKICRVCGSTFLSIPRKFKPYVDYEFLIYDCKSCQCRYTERDGAIYERLHHTESTYSVHVGLGDESKYYFDQNDKEGLEKVLIQIPKNKFIIDFLKKTEGCKNILEIGCSRGYLSSYSILLDKNFHGHDISETAIKSANQLFGEYFSTQRTLESFNDKYFDLIYHVGTIGCVEEPVNFIKQQLQKLKPGGYLLFNSPNLDVCEQLCLEWVTGTTPPDLVTLFPPTFWENHFSEHAEVNVNINYDTPIVSYLRRRKSKKAFSDTSNKLFEKREQTSKSHIYKILDKMVRKMDVFLPPVAGFKPLPQEFGVFVTMRVRN